MFTAYIVIIHASRSVTTGLSRILPRQQRRSLTSLVPVLGRRFGAHTYPRTFQKWLPVVPHQQQQSSLLSSNESNNSGTIDNAMGIPTIKQLRSDSFMKQVRYAEFITGLIEEDNGRETDVLMNRLRAQLSHPDGIRGFMVTYLTTSAVTNTADGMSNDDEGVIIPSALLKAVLEQIDPISDANELISLMCMNVIMPTGMITMQPNEEMSQQSVVTAKRATQLLKAVLNHCSSSTSKDSKTRSAITSQCRAILAVATDKTNTEAGGTELNHDEQEKNAKRQTFWRNFFQKWGYQSQQKSDIATAIRLILSQQQ